MEVGLALVDVIGEERWTYLASGGYDNLSVLGSLGKEGLEEGERNEMTLNRYQGMPLLREG